MGVGILLIGYLMVVVVFEVVVMLLLMFIVIGLLLFMGIFCLVLGILIFGCKGFEGMDMKLNICCLFNYLSMILKLIKN